MPFLSLQPLVENAVRHGLEAKEGGGPITITAQDSGAFAEISVEDDGVGIDPVLELRSSGRAHRASTWACATSTRASGRSTARSTASSSRRRGRGHAGPHARAEVPAPAAPVRGIRPYAGACGGWPNAE